MGPLPVKGHTWQTSVAHVDNTCVRQGICTTFGSVRQWERGGRGSITQGRAHRGYRGAVRGGPWPGGCARHRRRHRARRACIARRLRRAWPMPSSTPSYSRAQRRVWAGGGREGWRGGLAARDMAATGGGSDRRLRSWRVGERTEQMSDTIFCKVGFVKFKAVYIPM